MSKRSLVEFKGATSIYIDVEITEEGNVQFSGQDIGEAPERAFGDSDYEYWLVIKAADKLRLFEVLGGNGRSDKDLLDQIEAQYSGDTRVISKLMDRLKAKGIPYEFFSY